MPAIYYHPEAFSISGPRLMGRNAAGESFLRGFLKYSRSKEFWAQVEQPDHAVDFANKVLNSGRSEQVLSVNKSSLKELSQAEVLFYPGPDIGKQAFHRTLHGNGLWSLCGITHTTSSDRAMDSIVDLITSPIQPWDALICTSKAVKDNVESILQAQIYYLKDRLGIAKFAAPELPIIPLGIHTDDFNFNRDEVAESRKSLGVSENSLVVLYLGRLSFHAKAHPLAMYQALEKAFHRTNKEVVLIECGWHANDEVAKIYKETAEEFCPNIKLINIDGRKAANRQMAWASADIFCSLSDNIQETFGIVPIEAMAAGIPVVVSDWDGYKDTVRDGIDGFRIPTNMPQDGLGKDLAYRHALGICSYDLYCGLNCSLISIEIESTAKAFEKLFQSQELRSKMGEAGRKRARENYDWSVIIRKYEILWEKLNQIRKIESDKVKPLNHPWPARMDPFHGFASYPTNRINKQSILALNNKDLNSAINQALNFRQIKMFKFAELILPKKEEITTILTCVQENAKSVAQIIEKIDHKRQPHAMRGLSWLLKTGVLVKIS